MNSSKYLIIIVFPFLFACDFLDPEELSLVQGDDVYANLTMIDQALATAYYNLPVGYNNIGNSWLAAASDEMEAVYQGENIQNFNIGNWSPYSNPDTSWNRNYRGIRQVCDILQGTDTLSWGSYEYSNPTEYKRRVKLTNQYRAEARFLRAFFYAELIKRHGGVPLVTTKLDLEEDQYYLENAERDSYEKCVSYIVSECDAVRDSLPLSFANAEAGRATRGAAMALKSRVLLYAASDLFNQAGNTNELTGYTSGNRQDRWKAAARAALDVINLNQYSLHTSYQGLFVLTASNISKEVIFERRTPSSQTFDALNYPIGYEKGQTTNCPAGNLVDAYEMADGTAFDWNNPVHAADPYNGRDPRLKMSILTNNELWAGRRVEIWEGGLDGLPRNRATKTGYYLKKFVTDNLDLNNGDKVSFQWIYMRFGEIYLNYAEAMNEAFGDPAYKDGEFTMSAEEALNQVRGRTGVLMPPVAGLAYSDFRVRLQHERRIELAFENHRWWDVRRWMTGEELGKPVTGVKVLKDEASMNFTYTPFEVEKRYFDASRMYLYPIPQSEISKTGNHIKQNPNWN